MKTTYKVLPASRAELEIIFSINKATSAIQFDVSDWLADTQRNEDVFIKTRNRIQDQYAVTTDQGKMIPSEKVAAYNEAINELLETEVEIPALPISIEYLKTLECNAPCKNLLLILKGQE